ncbi:MAG TPA: DUF6056 family protein [Kofleriaceae bacterium]|nr:DUF6056 family protein [Kofleriaceae bacterium]
MLRLALRTLFVVYAAATAVHIGVVLAHEPFVFDAWNVAADTRAEPFSLARWVAYGAFEYTHANPRIGQWLTYLAYKLSYFASIATPLAYLALAAAVTTLGLGRWPCGKRPGERHPSVGRDLALCAIAIGFLWFAIPRIGMLMFCRAYGANYLYSAAIQLWFLVPLRLRPDGRAGRSARVAYAVLAVVAGMCNEHTGPTLVVLVLGYTLWRRRTTGHAPPLGWIGAAGSAAGFCAIFFAPGQDFRYDELASKVSLVGRVLHRGIADNLDIFRDWMIACAPAIGLAVVALVIARREASAGSGRLRAALGFLGLALAAGTLVTATVFVSPKLGPRFYLHGAALVLAGLLGVVDATLTTPRRLAPFVALAVAASGYAAARSLPLYLRLSRSSAARIAALEAAPPGSVFTAEALDQIEPSWWFLGDDLRDVMQRKMVASYFGLRGIVFRAIDADAPLGVSDVRLVPRYQIAPASCVDDHGGFNLGDYRGMDVRTIQDAMEVAIRDLRARIAGAGTLERLELAVEFVGATPRLPRPRILIGRWRPEGLEAYPGAIVREGRSTSRSVRLPDALRGSDLEIVIYVVGDEPRRLGTARDPGLTYVPWRRGTYWALACRADECFVLAVARTL